MKDTPRTILMTADTVGGVWIYATDLARHFGRRGIRTVLATMGGEPDTEARAAAEDIEGLVVETSPYSLEWMQDPWEDVARAGEWLLDLERTYRPEVVHLNNFVHGGLPWSAPALVVGHSCVCSWFRAVRGADAPAEWDRYRREVASGLRAAEAVTAPTRSMLATLHEHYGLFRSAGVVYNSRKETTFLPLPKEDFVLTAGRLWDEGKNVLALDAAAMKVDWPVLAAGSIRHPDGGEVSFGSVQALGRMRTEALADWMGRAAIYALPARYEPFGLTALEAAYAGCALVLGDIPTLREVWQDAALFVPPDDHDRLADAINSLIADRDLRQTMAVRARRRADEFTPERMVQSYLDIYVRMIARFERRKQGRRAKGGKQQPRVQRTGSTA